jgi:DNA invertase Pin-like site-specific DNA recombinase
MATPDDIVATAFVVGDPRRFLMLLYLDEPLPIGKLALKANVSPSTAAHHVQRLEAVGLVSVRRRGRRQKAAVYLRCSTDRGHTDNQAPAVHQLARARGFEVVHVFEENVSAVKERTEWSKLKEAAHRGEFQAVVVFAIDRLGRTMVGNLQELLDLDRRGVAVLSVREPWLDMGGPVRELLIGIFSWVAQEERRQIASRCRAGQERARRQGVHVGRPRAPVDVEQALHLRAQGHSIRDTARKLGVSPSVLHRALRGGVPEVALGDGHVQCPDSRSS